MPTQTVVVDSGASGKFTVDSRYAFIKKLGGGAYGLVAQFNDSVTGEVVAIKKTTKAFDDPVDAKRTLRELKLLNHLNHENIVRLVDVLPGGATGAREQQDVYAAMESMDTDLHQIIRSKQALTDEHAQYFMYQLLCALQFMHSADVLHRDLKPGCVPAPAPAAFRRQTPSCCTRASPLLAANSHVAATCLHSNLLVNKNCDLKVCDFGLARIASGVGGELEKTDPMTEYVITRWYRPPELILVRPLPPAPSRTPTHRRTRTYARAHARVRALLVAFLCGSATRAEK